MAYIFKNNAFSFLTGDIDATAQDITVRTADAVLFPQPDPAKGELFVVTIEDWATNKTEVCECFRRVGPTLSLRRGREGTSPEVFAAGATVSNRLTARTIEAGLLGWVEFNRRYLGAYAQPPTLDPMGFPIQPGAVFYDLNTDSLFVFTRDGWVKWSPSGDLQTGIPPGGVAGDVLTRDSAGLIGWRPVVDQSSRDSSQLARDAAAAAAATAEAARQSANAKLPLSGGILTGPLYVRGAPDAQGNRWPTIYLDSAGPNGIGQLAFTHAGKLTRMLSVVSGELQAGIFDANGALQAWRRLLLDGDALPVTGGNLGGNLTVGGALTTMGFANFNAGARTAYLTLGRQNTTLEGGELAFEPPTPGHHGHFIDNAINQMRVYRTGDFAMLWSLDLVTGAVNTHYDQHAGNIFSRNDIRAEQTVWGSRFRFWPDSAGDTGYDWSGDGYSTIFSNGQPVAQFQPGGHVYVWGNITGFSDARMKEEIEPVADATLLIRQLNPITFRRKGDADRSRYLGFIAQEVEPLLPEVVTRTQDGMLGINYAVMVALLAGALKEMDARVTELEEDAFA